MLQKFYKNWLKVPFDRKSGSKYCCRIGALVSIHGAFGATEKLPNPLPQSLCLWAVGGAFRVDPVGGGGLGILQCLQVDAQVCYPESGKTGLPASKEITGTALPQIFLSNTETVIGLAEC